MMSLPQQKSRRAGWRQRRLQPGCEGRDRSNLMARYCDKIVSPQRHATLRRPNALLAMTLKGEFMDDLYYSDYIELDKILSSQHPKSFSSLEEGNDEMLFIIIHQAYELWFKQILFELDLVRNIFIRGHINDNSDDMSRVVYRLKRVVKILELVNQQVSVLETMTALDFLEFRNHLLPASGFQSKQFRLIEARLGLKMGQRYKAEYYKSTRRGSLSAADQQEVNQVESESTLKELIVQWLERMPFFEEGYWKEYK